MLTLLGKGESGQGALAMVLLLLMLGAVLLTPLLVSMSTGVKSGQVYESKMQEFYAAEAGVEDPIWKIKDRNLSASYSLGEEINDRNVTVTIEDNGGGIYLINSTATSDDGGSTTVESYVSLPMDFSNLLDNAIVSDGDAIIRNSDISGNITYGGDLTVTGTGGINGTASQESLDWPTAADLSGFYADEVEGQDYPYHSIDVQDYNSIGPLYRDGSLSVDNTGSPGTLQLNGTVYVTGDLDIGTTRHDFTLVLNNQTIYCEGNIWVGGKCTVTGSGCIIAAGDATVKPGMESSPDDFILVMSLTGKVDFQPTGDFYGCLAGDAEVEIKNGDLTWADPSVHDLNFPMDDGDGGTGGGELCVLSWQTK